MQTFHTPPTPPFFITLLIINFLWSFDNSIIISMVRWCIQEFCCSKLGLYRLALPLYRMPKICIYGGALGNIVFSCFGGDKLGGTEGREGLVMICLYQGRIFCCVAIISHHPIVMVLTTSLSGIDEEIYNSTDQGSPDCTWCRKCVHLGRGGGGGNMWLFIG